MRGVRADYWSNVSWVLLLPRNDHHLLSLLSESQLLLSFLLGFLHLNLPLVTLLQPVDKAKLLYPQSLVFLVVTPVFLQN